MSAVQDDQRAGQKSGDAAGTGVIARIDLLGPFRAGTAGRPLGEGLGRKAQALLAYLAATPGHRASRERLASLLWGERFDEQARQSLRQTLMALRRSLEDRVPGLLAVDRIDVALAPGQFVTDLADFDHAAASGDPADLRVAAALWRGGFLTDLDIPSPEYEDWLRSQREAWRLRMVAVLMQLAETLLATGERSEALLTINRLVDLDPLNEAARRLELAAVARFSGAAAALQSYQSFAALLDRELGVAPAAETRALAAQLGADDSAGSAVARQPIPAFIDAAAVDVKRGWWRHAGILALALLALGGVAGGLLWHGQRETVPPVAAVAVKPALFSFHVIESGDTAGRTLRDDFRTKIALLPMASLTAERRLAAYAIEAAVQPAGGSQQIANIRVIETATEQTLWADRVAVTTESGSRVIGDAAIRLYAELLMVRQQRLGPPPEVSAALQAGWDMIAGGITRERTAEGRRFFQAAVDATPDDPGARLGLAQYISIDLVNRWSRQREADTLLALGHLEQAVMQVPRSLTAYLTLGMLHKARRDYPRALMAWQVQLAINPRDASVHSQVAHVNLLMGNIAEGLERAELAIRLHPSSRVVDRAYFYAGMGYLLSGEYQLAEQRLAQAIAANPVLPDAYAWRVAALAQADRQIEAEALYADMLRRFPWWNVDHHFTQAVDRSVMERFSAGMSKVAHASR
jgi:DNA-binding SARP family transcriptional activator